MTKVAVILSGCGFLDGSEIHESVLCLLALGMEDVAYQCFAPDMKQVRVVNHLNNEEQSTESRNVLVESARISRGKVLPLKQLNEQEFDGLLIPGGFGAALNLSSFAEDGESCSVHPEFARVVRAFIKRQKPIGATCISPAVVARVLQEDEVSAEMTLGTSEEYAEKLENMGMKSTLASVDDVVTDERLRIFTTPCYMEPDNLSGMFTGIQKMIACLLKELSVS